jgi:bifunctional non-homologous end joining protein LigD
MVLDLGPGEGVPWAKVCEAALLVRTMLEELSLECWLKTSEGKGLHIDAPIRPEFTHLQVKQFSQKLVQHLARTIPQLFVARSGAANRVGKIFVDYLRNGQSQTTVAAFSARTRPGLGISMTLRWEELAKVERGDQWNILSAPGFLRRRKDPWTDYSAADQGLKPAMESFPV